MGPARIIVFAVAGIAALGVLLIAHGLMSRKPPPPAPVVAVAPPPAPMTQVLVAKRDLATGTSLAEGDLDWQPMPAEKVRADFITNGAAIAPASGAAALASNATAVAAAAVSSSGGPMQALYGSIVRAPIAASEPITEAKLVRGGGGGYMAVVLHPGMRAMAVPVTVGTGVGGFILPGDRVDVLVTAPPMIGANGSARTNLHVTRTILSNVRILAIDQTVDDRSKEEKDKGKTGVIGRTATLELDPLQVEQLATAQATGVISLALRSVADNGETALRLRTRTTNTISRVRVGSIEVVRIARTPKPADETFDTAYDQAADPK